MAVNADLVREYDFVVISLRVVNACEHTFFVCIFQDGWPRDARFKLQDFSIVAGELIGKTWHIGSGTDKAHVAD